MNKIDRALYAAAQRLKREPEPQREPQPHRPGHVVVRIGPYRICRDLHCRDLVVQ